MLLLQIEQLKSKDKVISQLERELGHPAVFAGPVSMTTEVTRTSSSGQHSNKMETPPLSPHKILSGLSQAFQTLHGTSVASVSIKQAIVAGCPPAALPVCKVYRPIVY